MWELPRSQGYNGAVEDSDLPERTVCEPTVPSVGPIWVISSSMLSGLRWTPSGCLLRASVPAEDRSISPVPLENYCTRGHVHSLIERILSNLPSPDPRPQGSHRKRCSPTPARYCKTEEKKKRESEGEQARWRGWGGGCVHTSHV